MLKLLGQASAHMEDWCSHTAPAAADIAVSPSLPDPNVYNETAPSTTTEHARHFQLAVCALTSKLISGLEMQNTVLPFISRVALELLWHVPA